MKTAEAVGVPHVYVLMHVQVLRHVYVCTRGGQKLRLVPFSNTFHLVC